MALVVPPSVLAAAMGMFDEIRVYYLGLSGVGRVWRQLCRGWKWLGGVAGIAAGRKPAAGP